MSIPPPHELGRIAPAASAMSAQAGRPAWPLRLLLTLWLLVLLAWLGVLCLGWNAISLVLRAVLSPARARAVGRAGIQNVFRLYWGCARASGLMRLEAEALDVLRDEPGGLIVAANHPSLLDAVMIVARLPRSTCVMKASLMRNPFLGAGARLAGYVLNDVPLHMVRSAVESLREGAQLVMFPEGTRSPSPRQLLPFTRSIALIAQRAKVPIQTVIIETDSPYLGKGWPLWRLPPVPIVFRARLGPRFDPDPDHDALLARLQDCFQQELRK